jgi:hypothetical protein
VQVVQAHLAAHRFPCPRPLLSPTAVEAGIAVVEELLNRGVRACAHDPQIRGAVAHSLVRIVDLCRGFRALPHIRPSLLASPTARELWPEPHDRRFDFARTAAGAGWIDELAAQARVRLAASSGEIVVAHSDWRAEHIRFEDEEIVAAYDWQSIAVGREPALVGAGAHAFTADWGIAQARRLPTLDESRAFVADHEAARGARFRRQSETPSTPPGYTRRPTALAASTPTHNSASRERKRRSPTTATAACSRATGTNCSRESTSGRLGLRGRYSPLGQRAEPRQGSRTYQWR